MRRGLIAAMLAVCVLRAADHGPKQSFEVSQTERIPFQPGGTIQVENSYGYLVVEGWDAPEVEVTVTKSTDRFAWPDHKARAEHRFEEEVRVATTRTSDQELRITTNTPSRNSLLTSVLPSGRLIVTTPVPPNNKRGITVEYRVHVPRNSRLVVHQDNGYVWVSDVAGDIEVDSHTGDLIVMLPDAGLCNLDARTMLGNVTSDLPGEVHRRWPLGTHFRHASEAATRRVQLRMGRGSITIKANEMPVPVSGN